MHHIKTYYKSKRLNRFGDGCGDATVTERNPDGLAKKLLADQYDGEKSFQYDAAVCASLTGENTSAGIGGKVPGSGVSIPGN